MRDALPNLPLNRTAYSRRSARKPLKNGSPCQFNAAGLLIVSAPGVCNFHKSMTTHADYRIWQDVYHTKTASGDEVYLKLTVIDDVLIVSFKEL